MPSSTRRLENYRFYAEVRSELETDVVNTCGLCESICREDEIPVHPCLKSFPAYYIDKNTRYFYPQYEDGSILRRSLVGDEELNIIETPSESELIQQAPDEESFAKENVPINVKQLKVFLEERLIEAIRRRLALWNFRLPIAERGIRTKEKLWMEVATVMQGFITSEEAKKKWNSLSDTYRKNKKESEMPSGSGARKKIKWIHMDRMEFLGDVCLQSKTTTNIISNDSLDDDDSSNYNQEESMSSRSSSRIDSRHSTRLKSNTVLKNIEDILNEPIHINIPTNDIDNDQYAAFGVVIAAKLRALSEDASERAMVGILNILQAERRNDKKITENKIIIFIFIYLSFVYTYMYLISIL
ncbi:hypothetical protein ALC60_11694 [Trachymyrmex zeteki]|uniref:MADF domain-containing protein n=1 Tax=Mycetomoellerius zeteki TaxID=64791 RepID=A0A151WN59_9HYME|nr:hypothetical protein ALC60_11694 [Trachymyrmex zeteki]